MSARSERAVSPVVGVALLLVITLLLAGTVGAFALGIGMNEETAEGLVEGEVPTETATDSPSDGSALIFTRSPGDEPRTNQDQILEFRIENTRDEAVTIVGFAVDASGIDTGIDIDDDNADEVEIRRSETVGVANRDDGGFEADGTTYEFVANSTNGGENASIPAGADDAEVDLRTFSHDFEPLVIAESEEDADLTVRLLLEDGSSHAFHFKESS